MTDSDAGTQSGKNGAAPTGLIIGVIIAILLAVAVIVALVVRGGDEDTQDTAQEPPAAESTTEQAPSQEADEGENLPGAAVGNKQRTWPSFGDKYDDSAHATPGQTSASWWKQRPVWTPNNHDGDFPKKADLKESMKQCDKPDSITLDGKTQQQYVNARYLVVNDQAGPTKSVRGVPRGYARSPQGAIVSAINTVGYGMFSMKGVADEIGYEAEKQLWSSSKGVMEEQGKRKKAFDNKNSRAELLEPADGFIVRTCSEDLVVVELILDGFEEATGGRSEDMTVLRVPMAWRDGDWIPDLSGTGESQFFQDTPSKVDFTQVDYR